MIELDPWGGETDRCVNQWEQPYRYTTYERDGNGVDRAVMRSYHRWWTRFNEPDPWDWSYDLTDPQSFNRYTYVQNDPVNFTDSSGLLRVAVLVNCRTNWVWKEHVEGGGDWYDMGEVCELMVIEVGGGEVGGGGGGAVAVAALFAAKQTEQQRERQRREKEARDCARKAINDAQQKMNQLKQQTPFSFFPSEGGLYGIGFGLLFNLLKTRGKLSLRAIGSVWGGALDVIGSNMASLRKLFSGAHQIRLELAQAVTKCFRDRGLEPPPIIINTINFESIWDVPI